MANTTLEKFPCGRLSHSYNDNERLIVPVKFDNENNPVGIMCDYYKKGKGECKAKGYSAEDCIYKSWKSI